MKYCFLQVFRIFAADMEKISDVFQVLSSFLWGWLMIILLLGTHVFLTFRLRIPYRDKN